MIAGSDAVPELLAVVDADRERRLQQILEQTQSRVAGLLGDARSAAHQVGRKALREQRTRSLRRMATARSELALAERRLSRSLDAELLRRAVAKLEAELVRRWNQPDTRASWWTTALAQARGLLPARPWRIDVGPLPESELTQLTALAPPGSQAMTQADIDAGLRIACAGACLDATLRGLLAQRNPVDGRILLELDKERCRE